MTDRRAEILARLEAIEREHRVRVMYACESGSRAWGFASTDSDWDVRLVYVRPLDWYLSIEDRRDVLELPITDGLDVGGWDLRKALQLFRKSNPPLLEWLVSPIVYVDRDGLAEELRSLRARFFSPRSAIHHYLHMAQGNFREYLRTDVVRLKKYLYVLRPLLACRWIARTGTMAPMEFQRVLDSDGPVGPVRAAIDSLLARKSAGEELAGGPRDDFLNGFIEAELSRFELEVRAAPRAADLDVELLDRVFRAHVPATLASA